MTNETRKQLARHLRGGMAFLPADKFLENIPFDQCGLRIPGVPYSLYEQVVHMVRAQRDILDFCTDPDYREHTWPDDYWPDTQAPDDEEEWKEFIRQFFADRDKFEAMIMDESLDLGSPVVNDTKKTYLREILLVIEHNAYHTGQLLVIMRGLGVYEA